VYCLYANGLDQPPTGYNWPELELTVAFYTDLFEYWAFYSLDYDGGTTRDMRRAKDSWDLIYGTDYTAFAYWVSTGGGDAQEVPGGVFTKWEESDLFRSTGFDPYHYEPPDGNGLYDNYSVYHHPQVEGSHKSASYQFFNDVGHWGSLYSAERTLGHAVAKSVMKDGIMTNSYSVGPEVLRPLGHDIKKASGTVKRFFKKAKKKFRLW